MTLPIQVSGKYGDAIVVIGGTDPADFQNNVLSILGPDSLETVGKLFELALVQAAETTAHQKAQDAVLAGGLATSPATEGVSAPEVPATKPGNAAPPTETDNFGRVFTYAIPGAPSCPHGERVQMKAKGKNPPHKPYTAWVCPTTTPYAFRNKIQKANDCGMEFAK